MSSTRAHESSKLGQGVRRATVWITGDQLLADHPAVKSAEAEYGRDGFEIVLIESRARLSRRGYHRHKLVLVLSAMRHYAGEMRRRGYAVDYQQAGSLSAGLTAHLGRVRPEKVL